MSREELEFQATLYVFGLLNSEQMQGFRNDLLHKGIYDDLAGEFD